MTHETLAPDIAWESSGHLSEVALSIVSDGEEALLTGEMHAHLHECEACAVRLGEIAIRSANVADAIASLPAPATGLLDVRDAVVPQMVITPGPSPLAPVPSRRKVPVIPIAVALVVAAFGAVPSILGLPAQAHETISLLHKVLPLFVRMAPQAIERAWRGSTGHLSVVVWGLSCVLIATGLGIARRASRKMAVDGGRR